MASEDPATSFGLTPIPLPSTNHPRALRPARSFNTFAARGLATTKQQDDSRRPREHSSEAGSAATSDAEHDGRTREDSYASTSYGSSEGDPYAHFNDVSMSPPDSVQSHELATAGNVSATTHAPSTSFLPTTSQDQNKENVAHPPAPPTRRRPLPLSSLPPRVPLPSLPAASTAATSPNVPNSASTSSSSHIRIRAKASTFGFPYSASILATSDSFADLRGPGGRTTAAKGKGKASLRSLERDEGSEVGGTSDDSHRSSSDVDLDLSFDFHHAGVNGGGAELDDEGRTSTFRDEDVDSPDWVGADRMSSEEDYSVDEPMLVEEKEHVSEPTGLRAAFLAGEKAAREKEQAVDNSQQEKPYVFDLNSTQPTTRPAPGGSKRISWAHAPSTSQSTFIPVGSLGRKRVPKPLDPSYRQLSTSLGYAYNPTDPLPSPPIAPPVQSSSPPRKNGHSSSPSASFPLPLRLIERSKRHSIQQQPSSAPATTSVAAPSPSPSRPSEARTRHERAKRSSVQIDMVPLDGEEYLRRRRVRDSALLGGGGGNDERVVRRRPSWAEGIARSTLAYFGTKSQRSPHDPTSSPEPSPMFSSDGRTTAPTTPNDTPLLQGYEPKSPYSETFGEDEPVQLTLMRSRQERHGRLDGLGLDLHATTADEQDQVRPLRPRSRIISPPPVDGRRGQGHSTIPSLSISPPPPEDDDARSFESDSPSRRLSDRSSRRLSGQYTAPSTTSRRLFDTSAPQVDSNDQDEQSPTASRFSWTPAPLRLVRDKVYRAAGYSAASPRYNAPSAPVPSPPEASTHLTLGNPQHSLSLSPTTSAAALPRRRSILSLAALATRDPDSKSIEDVLPAKLAFIAGFLLGPWCWIIGGWWLRSLDGELRSTKTKRCREKGCKCGRALKWYQVARATQHGVATLSKSHSHEQGGALMWSGVDQWVFMNRVAAVGSGTVVSALVAVAVWCAIVGA